MRIQPRRGRRIPGPNRYTKDFLFEAPPELPRIVPQSIFKKSLPWIFGVAIIGLVILMFSMGMRQMNPMYLVFMMMMGLAMVQSMQNSGGNDDMTTPKVDSERAEYLRYTSEKAKQIREAAAAQRAAAEWSHPDPEVLEAVLDSPRLWERGATDEDYLKVRVGRDLVRLANKIKVKAVDTELDLEPVTKMSLNHLRAVQQVIPHCPRSLDLAGLGMIGVYGERELFRAATRAWIAQLVCWHNPNDTAVAVVSPELESQWGWAKWLLHAESQELDGAGPARYLGTSLRDIEAALEPLLKDRAKVVDEKGTVDPSQVSKAHKHVLLVIDDPGVAPPAVRRIAARDGVTVIAYRDTGGPDRDYETHERELLLRLRHGEPGAQTSAVQMDSWKNYQWQMFCAEPDVLDAAVAEYLARRMSKWDAEPIGRQDAESAATQTHLALLGITNAAKLDVEALWAPRMLPVGTGEPVVLEPILKVPAGLQPSGAPLIWDLKDEADGGMGPHGLMIGMTGSGKTTTLASVVLGLFARHSPDVLQAFLADFKDGAGFGAFADYPHVVGLATNMDEKKSLVERFGDTLLGLLDLRGRIFEETGMQIKGEVFTSIVQYNEARATPAGKHLPPMPYMLIWVDEFSLMLEEHPEMAAVFDKVARKGRSQGVYFKFASQTLDVGVNKDIEKNTQYRICLKVSSPSISRQIIGTEDAFHIPAGKNFKGTGYLVRAPGAQPEKFRGFLLPDRYEPPTTVNRKVITATPRARVFTAGPVERDPETVIEEVIEAESVVEGPPRSLVLTIGPQLSKFYGKRPPQLWVPPLDDPIPLDSVLTEAAALPAPSGSAPWWPLGKIDRPRRLTHELLTYSADQGGTGNVRLLAADQAESSMVVQTFILSAAARYAPTDVGFYAFSYGGPALATVRNLPHVGAIGGKDRSQLNKRIFADLDAMVRRRQQLFDQYDVGSLEEYRRRRHAGETALDDGYPIDLFVIVDGHEGFINDNTSIMHPKNPLETNLNALAGAGNGIHVVVTARNWVKMSMGTKDTLSVQYELKLTSPTDSLVKKRPDSRNFKLPQELIPADQPGRGLTQNGEVIRFAVARIDGQATMDDLDSKVRETVAEVISRYPGVREVPAPQLLPTRVQASMLPQNLGGERYAIGLRERDLQPQVVDFADSPLLAVYGDAHHGKTPFIENMVRSVVARRRDHNDALIAVFDPDSSLKNVTSLLTWNEDIYETTFEGMANFFASIAQICDQRKPPAAASAAKQGWDAVHEWSVEGPKIYLFIDDLDLIPQQVMVHEPAQAGGAGAAPVGQMVSTWAPLLRHLPNARRVGLRVVMTRNASQVAAAEMSATTLPGAFATHNANRLLLGSSAQNEKVRGVKLERLAPGRAYLVAARSEDSDYVQLTAPHEM